MTTNQIEFGGSDEAAIEYIRKRGYASYSSMVSVRDKKVPELWIEKPYYIFGKEVHSRFLEHKKLVTLGEEEEKILSGMVNSLADDSMVRRIMEGSKYEIDFDTKLNGLRVFGRIDILCSNAVADLKTTYHNTLTPFIHSMDFLQAALYMRASKRKDFYYIGVSKKFPHKVMVVSVNQYPLVLKKANNELNYLLKYIKSKL